MQEASAELRRPPGAVLRWGWLRSWLRADRRALGGQEDLIGATLAVLGALAAASFSLQLWHAHLNIPFTYGSDALQGQMYIKAVINGGWIWHVHDLGAPFGNELFDFPQGTDNLNYVVIKLIGLVWSDSARAMNAFFLLTFVTNAFVAYLVLRWWGVSAPASVVCAILFSDSPYHLFRGETHLLLSSYSSVPMGAYLVLSVVDGRRLFGPRMGSRGLRAWATRRNALLVVLCVMIGSLGIYFAIFTALLVAAAAGASLLSRRSWRPVAQAAAVIVLIGAVTFINDLPAAIYRDQHGTDQLVAKRLPQESELYALKLAEMVLPVPGHRIPTLASVRKKYDSTTPVVSEDAQQSLGIVSSLGLVWLFIVALVGLATHGAALPWLNRHRPLAFAALSAFLLGTLGGVSALIGYLVSSQIRGWDRISIYIMFFAIAAVGLGLDSLRRRLGAAGRWRWLAALAIVLGIGVYDQSSTVAIPPYAANDVSYASDAQFVARIERLMPRGADIYQLPYVPFPENPPVNRMIDYDLGRGYIHSQDLRWSYGAIKGRHQDFAVDAQSLPVPTLLDALVAAGFDGLWIDRYGYADNGAAIASQVQSALGGAPIGSNDGRLLFFDLRPLAVRLRASAPSTVISGLGRALLNPPVVTYGTGFYPDESGSRWAVARATAIIDNASSTTQRIVLQSIVQTLGKGAYHLTVVTPDGAARRVAIGPNPRPVQLFFSDPPGEHAIRLTTDAPVLKIPTDPRQLSVHYGDLELGAAAIAPFLTSVPPGTLPPPAPAAPSRGRPAASAQLGRARKR